MHHDRPDEGIRIQQRQVSGNVIVGRVVRQLVQHVLDTSLSACSCLVARVDRRCGILADEDRIEPHRLTLALEFNYAPCDVLLHLLCKRPAIDDLGPVGDCHE